MLDPLPGESHGLVRTIDLNFALEVLPVVPGQALQDQVAAAAIRAISANKPVVVLKAGKSALGSRIAITHTGSLAGTDEAFQALVDQLGMIRGN